MQDENIYNYISGTVGYDFLQGEEYTGGGGKAAYRYRKRNGYRNCSC